MGEELIVPSASSDRSVQMAVDALRDQGHEVRSFIHTVPINSKRLDRNTLSFILGKNIDSEKSFGSFLETFESNYHMKPV